MSGRLLRLYTDTVARQDAQPLYRWLLGQARECGAAQAAAFHASSGFGRSGQLKEIRFPEVQMQEPVVVEIYADGVARDRLRARLSSAGVDVFFAESAAEYQWIGNANGSGD